MAESLTHLINPKSQSALTVEESADRERQRWNAVSLEEFADSGVPPRQILKDRELATAWIIDRPTTTVETSKFSAASTRR